jgi:hypothetical protein
MWNNFTGQKYVLREESCSWQRHRTAGREVKKENCLSRVRKESIATSEKIPLLFR